MGKIRQVKDHLYGVAEGFSGKSGAEAAERGAQLQYDATLKGIEEQRLAREQIHENLSGFRDLANPYLLNAFQSMPFQGLDLRNLPTPQLNNYNTAGLQNVDVSRVDTSDLPDLFNYDFSSDSLVNQMTDQVSRQLKGIQAAQGKAGAGETPLKLSGALAPIYMDRLNQLAGLRNQTVNERMGLNSQLFGQQFGLRGQQFGEMMGAGAQNFSEASSLRDQLFGEKFNMNNLKFNQLASVLGNAQNAAAGQGAATTNSANAISDLYGQGGNALAAGGIGASNAYAQGAQNMVGLGSMIASFFSDERMKEDMEPIGKDENGMTVYKFKYKSPEFVGYAAQEVAQRDPSHALLDPSGYLKVTAKYAPKRVS